MTPGAFRICVADASHSTPLLLEVISEDPRLEAVHTRYDDGCDIYWFGKTGGRESEFHTRSSRLHPWQRVNKFVGAREACSKTALARTLLRCGGPSWWPETYDTRCDATALGAALAAAAPTGSGGGDWWILKASGKTRCVCLQKSTV